MTCATDGNLTICRPPESPACVRYLYCPTCERRRRMAQWFMGAWYGDSITCLSCGDAWCGGEMAPRPFQRGWRKESIRRAREHLAGWSMKVNDYRAWRRAEIEAEMCWDA